MTTRVLAVAVAAALGVGPVCAQQAGVSTSIHRFTFGDPGGSGLRAYEVGATTLSVSYPIRDWLVAGTRVGFARASLTSWSEADEEMSGATDLDLYADAAVGPLLLRGSVTLDVGGSDVRRADEIVAGLASYELLPLPVRSWGRGTGYGAEARLPLSPVGMDLELVGAVRSHGSLGHWEGLPSEYRLGSEARVGFRMGASPSASSRVDIGAQLVFPAPDEAADQVVFTAGRRFAAFGVATFPVDRTAVILRADLYRRQRSARADPAGPSAFVIAPPRELRSGMIETRTSLGSFSLLTTAAGRQTRSVGGASQGRLLSGGVGVDLEVRGPWPGRLFLTPMGKGHWGDVNVAEGYDSSIAGWVLSIDLRWEAGR